MKGGLGLRKRDGVELGAWGGLAQEFRKARFGLFKIDGLWGSAQAMNPFGHVSPKPTKDRTS